MECPIEILRRDLAQVPTKLLASCIDDEDVEPAKALHRVLDKLPAPAFVASVSRSDCLATHRGKQGDDLAYAPFTRKIGDCNVRALPGKGDRSGTSDTNVASTDERLVAAQVAFDGLALLAMVRPWLKLSR